MMRMASLIPLAALLWTAAATAQEAAVRFDWRSGQVLKYKVEQTTTAIEVVEGKKTETASKLVNVKRWQVLDVDREGVATLQLSLEALRMEMTAPSGDALVFDSTDPDKSNPQLREQLSKYVGPPLAVLRINAKGKVVEVKESKHGPASRFESEPPFVVTLPETGLQAGQSWTREYAVTLEPPHGTGDKHAAAQTYTCKGIEGRAATIGLTTTIKELPQSPADQVPLLQMQPAGEIVFDTQAGRMQKASLRIDKEIQGHQGEGSSYKFQSTYTEQLVADK